MYRCIKVKKLFTTSQENLDFYFKENITSMAFKDNLITIRELRGKKPPQVIKDTGIKKQQYYAWEAGDYEPVNENLDILCHYFKVPKNLFFKEMVTKHDIMGADKTEESDAEWFKKTIETLIHQNGETIHEFRVRSKDEIENLRGDKSKLFDLLYIHLKPPQNGQQ